MAVVTHRKVVINAKTGEQHVEEYQGEEFVPTAEILKGINQQKLKALLKNNGLISNFSEVE